MTANVPMSETGIAENRNDRGPPRLQKGHDDHNDEQRAPRRCVWMTARSDSSMKTGGIVDDAVFEPLREILAQLAHAFAHPLGRRQGVRAGKLLDSHGHGGLAIEVAVHQVILRALVRRAPRRPDEQPVHPGRSSR